MRLLPSGTVINAKPTAESDCSRFQREQRDEESDKVKVSVPIHLHRPFILSCQGPMLTRQQSHADWIGRWLDPSVH